MIDDPLPFFDDRDAVIIMSKALERFFELASDCIEGVAMTTVNAFELLGVEQSASDEDIRFSYYHKAKLYHPDHGGKVGDFLNIKRAYEILSNPAERERIGANAIFSKPLIRMQPSLHSNIDVLIQNIEAVKDKLK
jgi:hypothetical protein